MKTGLFFSYSNRQIKKTVLFGAFLICAAQSFKLERFSERKLARNSLCSQKLINNFIDLKIIIIDS